VKLTTTDEGITQLAEVYNPIILRTNAGETLMVCMRDSGFELTYGRKEYRANEGDIYVVEKGGPVTGKPPEVDPTEEGKVYSIAKIEELGFKITKVGDNYVQYSKEAHGHKFDLIWGGMQNHFKKNGQIVWWCKSWQDVDEAFNEYNLNPKE